MPTLASIHSSQATISVEVQAPQPGTGSGEGLSADSMSGLVLGHSRVHLLLSPDSAPLCQASKALAGSRNCPREWGRLTNLEFVGELRCFVIHEAVSIKVVAFCFLWTCMMAPGLGAVWLHDA